jgi:hypothetical protein
VEKMATITCNRNCNNCTQLNTRVDNKDYPYGYDCLKYGDSVFENDFERTKQFTICREE